MEYLGRREKRLGGVGKMEVVRFVEGMPVYIHKDVKNLPKLSEEEVVGCCVAR